LRFISDLPGDFSGGCTGITLGSLRPALRSCGDGTEFMEIGAELIRDGAELIQDGAD